MTDRPCPFTLIDVLGMEFKPFDQHDWDGFAGCEGQPRIAEATLDDEHYTIVMDVMDDEIDIQVHWFNGKLCGAEQACWSWTLAGTPTQLL